jgi:CRP-like cAMP-binding protein
MNLEWLRERLSQLHFSAELPAAALDRVAEIGELRECRAGEALFREGSERREFYLLISGRLVLSMQVPVEAMCRFSRLGQVTPSRGQP